jgi:hypothetical protein
VKDTLESIEMDMYYSLKDIIEENVADDPIVPELLDKLFKDWKDRRTKFYNEQFIGMDIGVKL